MTLDLEHLRTISAKWQKKRHELDDSDGGISTFVAACELASMDEENSIEILDMLPELLALIDRLSKAYVEAEKGKIWYGYMYYHPGERKPIDECEKEARDKLKVVLGGD